MRRRVLWLALLVVPLVLFGKLINNPFSDPIIEFTSTTTTAKEFYTTYPEYYDPIWTRNSRVMMFTQPVVDEMVSDYAEHAMLDEEERLQEQLTLPMPKGRGFLLPPPPLGCFQVLHDVHKRRHIASFRVPHGTYLLVRMRASLNLCSGYSSPRCHPCRAGPHTSGRSTAGRPGPLRPGSGIHNMNRSGCWDRMPAL